MSEKKRLDQLLVDRGLAPSREKAKALIMAGQVYVQNQKSDKPGTSYTEAVEIEGPRLWISLRQQRRSEAGKGDAGVPDPFTG